MVTPPHSAAKLSIEVRHHFDPTLWKSAPLPPKPASTLLVTWTLHPEPVDGGMPPIVQSLFSAAVCALGTVYYAADAEAQTVATQIVEIQVRQSLRRHLITLFRAQSPNQVLPAFESGLHNWSLNAQWLLVTGPSPLPLDALEPLARTLYQDWHLPTPWPEDVLIIVQSGVDGDAAICHCRGSQIAEKLSNSLRQVVTTTDVAFQVLN